MSSHRVAVVSGGNKGIGYEIVRKLCSEFNGIVYLTARNERRGLDACEKLVMEGCKNSPKFHQLDIADEQSILAFRGHLKDTYNGVDVLVNNAGIAYKKASTAPFAEQAENTLKTNFTGTLNMCKHLFPLLKPHGRVVHVSSMAGRMAMRGIQSESLKAELTRPDLKESELIDLAQQFVESTKAGTHESIGWPSQAYAVSKLLLNALTIIQARDRPYVEETDVLINSCCPGYCDTDMTSHKGTKTAAQGAETPVMLAMIPPGQDHPHGKLYCELKETSWK